MYAARRFTDMVDFDRFTAEVPAFAGTGGRVHGANERGYSRNNALRAARGAFCFIIVNCSAQPPIMRKSCSARYRTIALAKRPARTMPMQKPIISPSEPREALPPGIPGIYSMNFQRLRIACAVTEAVSKSCRAK